MFRKIGMSVAKITAKFFCDKTSLSIILFCQNVDWTKNALIGQFGHFINVLFFKKSVHLTNLKKVSDTFWLKWT